MKEPYPNAARLKKFLNLSWLCLFPGFGILVGIVLLFYAIFEFKSKKLFLKVLCTMSGGLVLVFADSAYLNYSIMHSEDAKNEIAAFIPDDLDKIAQTLEIYKLKHGEYPKTLEELKRDFPFVSISDRLLDINPSAHTLNYYYFRSGDTYVLFSPRDRWNSPYTR